ncbi:MAG: hypothetical protein V1880_04345 [Patescibacteria group bacterium]
MQFINFQERLAAFPVFSLQDVRKLAPDFSRIQIDRWQKKGYLRKIRQGFYCLTGAPLNDSFLLYTANKIYSPSYISLETALKYYGLIPEEIFQITSVSTKKTTNFETPVGNFRYQHLKPTLFWGYRLLDFEKHKILMAEMEKAILDYLYLNPRLLTSDDFEGMRINADSFHRQINIHKFHSYLDVFDSRSLKRRATLFLNTLQND